MSDALIPCQDAVRQLWDYLDGSIESDDHDRLDQHLAFCQRCCGELEFIKHLRKLLAGQAPDPRSHAMERLEQFVEGLDSMTQDLMFADEIRRTVRAAYAGIPTGGGEPVTRRAYSAAELAEIPSGAAAWALGVGNPVRYAELEPGDTVLDVGSGGGIDTILAAHRVGPSGQVIGLDLLEEMCDRGRTHAAEAGVAAWTEFRCGQMEAVPLADDTVDVVVSNGVINLSARKSRALAEIFRVLRPGGQLCVSDLVVDEELPPQVLGSPSAWAGCISGALAERVFLNKLRNVGFEEVWIGDREPFGLAEAALYPLFTPENIEQLRDLLPVERHRQVATAVLVKARKPQAPS